MECNKDEAMRSCRIAEQKFLVHDLMGAKKFALKAQHLFPGLEGLPQLLAVLDVHIIAQDKVAGVDPDWYGILQTHVAADEVTIRKQYRKLALTLHPDKNKAVGAEGAFMLISEAWSVLSDQARKAAHDARRRHSKGGSPADGFCTFTNFNLKKWPRPKPSRKTPLLWIKCPSCRIEVQCGSAHEPNMIVCSVCHQAFTKIETQRTNMSPYCQGGEYSKSRGKINVVSKASEDQAHDVTNLAHTPTASGPTSLHCELEDPSTGMFTSSYHAPEELKHTSVKSFQREKGEDVRVTQDVSQPLVEQGAEESGLCAQTSRDCHPNAHVQFGWGSHRTRSPLRCSPAVMKATAEMVQNVFEAVKRERVNAQKEVREKAMKERIEAEKETRKKEGRRRREQKQRRKDEELKMQAKVALHAKKAFDKLFAREHRSSKEDVDIVSKTSFECKIDKHEGGGIYTNLEADYLSGKSLADLGNCQDSQL